MAQGDLARWLEGHGLAALAPVLAAQDVGLDLLPRLCEADLKELGLTLGQRRRLQLALAEQAPMEAAAADAQRAERWHLTVLFIDLVGSTALSERLDPEEMRELTLDFQTRAAREAARFGGHLAKFLGDGALAYFGWPRAHEDDAERAVRAARAILDEVAGIAVPGGGRLAARAGIATGPVMVEEGHGVGAAAETGISGETPNLAARLQAVAEPAEIVIAASTQRLVAGLFACADLGRRPLKGFTEPQPAFRVEREEGAETRFEARHALPRLPPILGRRQELARLLASWREAAHGRGRLVLLAGEAGIGKSRLVQALLQRVASRPHVRLRYQCSPFHVDSAFWPVVEQIARAAGIGTDMAADQRLERLRSFLAASPAVGAGDDLATLAQLLAIPVPGGAPPVAPAERKRRTLEALLRQLHGLMARSPVLLVVEDAHWIDPSTSELLDLAFAELHRGQALAVVTYRPEFAPPWRPVARAATLSLAPLARGDARALAARVAPGLPDELLARVVERADGVPLFLEELSRAAAESLAAAGTRTPATVPASLHDGLMARLDRLGGARRIAQAGAAIGRSFTWAVLSEIVDLPADRLDPALGDLVAAGLVTQQGVGAESRYVFKHALVQDAAYDSLLKSHRRELHGRIADALARRGDTAPEFLAHHLTAAGRTAAALSAWRRAAAGAVARAANLEATRHLERAMALLPDLPEATGRAGMELTLLLESAVPLIALHGFGSAAVARCAATARALAARVGDDGQKFAAARVAWNSCLMREPLPAAVAQAEGLVELAAAAADPARRAAAQRALGYSLIMSGCPSRALPILEHGVALADDAGDAAFALYGEHSGMVCRFYAAWSLALLGRYADSRRRAEEAVALARRLGNPHGLAWALVCAAVPAMFALDAEQALAHAREALEIARAYRLPQWQAFAASYGGWAKCRLGDHADGLADMDAGLSGLERTGAVLNRTILLHNRAEGRLARGDLAGARDDLAAGLAHAQRFGEGIVLPLLLRLKGEILGRAPAGREAALAALARGLEVADAQGAALWALRLQTAATSLTGTAEARKALARRLAAVDAAMPAADAARALLTATEDGHACIARAG
jgi:class 3 adenylate cyclase